MIDPSVRIRRAIHLNDAILLRRIIRTHPKLLQNPDFSHKSNTSLHLAAHYGHTQIASDLITAGHEAAAEISRNTDNDTPLMLAVRAGHLDAANLLVSFFPDGLAATNRAGMDALCLAAQQPLSAELIPVLLAEGADVAVRDREGNTPLHHASASGSLKALRMLLAAGADPFAKNSFDWTPLAYSQTVAAEVYFKNLVVEFERRKVEEGPGGAGERRGGGGVRLVEADGDGEELRRHWSPVERKRPMTPGVTSYGRQEWGLGVQHARTRSGS